MAARLLDGPSSHHSPSLFAVGMQIATPATATAISLDRIVGKLQELDEKLLLRPLRSPMVYRAVAQGMNHNLPQGLKYLNDTDLSKLPPIVLESLHDTIYKHDVISPAPAIVRELRVGCTGDEFKQLALAEGFSEEQVKEFLELVEMPVFKDGNQGRWSLYFYGVRYRGTGRLGINPSIWDGMCLALGIENKMREQQPPAIVRELRVGCTADEFKQLAVAEGFSEEQVKEFLELVEMPVEFTETHKGNWSLLFDGERYRGTGRTGSGPGIWSGMCVALGIESKYNPRKLRVGCSAGEFKQLAVAEGFSEEQVKEFLELVDMPDDFADPYKGNWYLLFDGEAYRGTFRRVKLNIWDGMCKALGIESKYKPRELRVGCSSGDFKQLAVAEGFSEEQVKEFLELVEMPVEFTETHKGTWSLHFDGETYRGTCKVQNIWYGMRLILGIESGAIPAKRKAAVAARAGFKRMATGSSDESSSTDGSEDDEAQTPTRLLSPEFEYGDFPQQALVERRDVDTRTELQMQWMMTWTNQLFEDVRQVTGGNPELEVWLRDQLANLPSQNRLWIYLSIMQQFITRCAASATAARRAPVPRNVVNLELQMQWMLTAQALLFEDVQPVTDDNPELEMWLRFELANLPSQNRMWLFLTIMHQFISKSRA